MKIYDFNYFGNQQIEGSKNTTKVTSLEFDLDLQALPRSPQGQSGAAQVSGHVWCALTELNVCTPTCVSVTVCH